MTKIYGIKNCDTMKKAFKWLDENNVSYDFHDYKKVAPDEAVLKRAIKNHGWESVLNKRGTTWRQLPDDVKVNMDTTNAISVAIENPSIIKRPLLDKGPSKKNEIYLGFSPAVYEEIFE